MITHEQILDYYKKCHPNEEDYSSIERLNTENLYRPTFGVKYEDYIKRARKIKKKVRKNKLNRENVTQRNIKQVFGLYYDSDLNRWKSVVTKREKILIPINVYYKETRGDTMWYLNHGDAMKVRYYENSSNGSSILEIKCLKPIYSYRLDYMQMKNLFNSFDETFEEMVQDRLISLTPDMTKALT